MQYVIRYCRTPTRYNTWQTMLIDAENVREVGIRWMEAMVRSGRDPAQYVPTISWHVKTLVRIERDGYDEPSRNPEQQRLATERGIAHHWSEIDRHLAEAVYPYVPDAVKQVTGGLDLPALAQYASAIK